ncbi:MAG: prenyltransferase/squalene oxidase repeat-containing protein [Candidatus Thorarchaeota archaeon]|jgi:prenyltransferase beta subunit
MKKVKVVAIAFAFTLVLLAFTAQPVAAASRYDSLMSYMNNRYDVVNHGYTIPGEGVTRIDPTYGAISIMNEVEILDDRPPPVTVVDVMDFVVVHQWTAGNEDAEPKYGGFMDYLLGPVDNGINYRGLVLWQLLKAQGDIPGTENYDINATANLFWINTTQTESGGFSSEAGVYPDLISTAYALMSLRIIDTLYPLENAWDWLLNETATVEWIESCKDGDVYKLSPISDRASVSATAAAVLAYNALDPFASVPGAGSIQLWLVSRQLLEYDELDYVGGFEEANGTGDPNLLSTYFALSAMEILNTLSTVNASAAEAFILNCQSEDGSFGLSPGLSAGKLVYSGYACESLNMLDPGGVHDILSSSTDPHSSGDPGIEWRWMIVLGIIVVALVLAVLSVRQD